MTAPAPSAGVPARAGARVQVTKQRRKILGAVQDPINPSRVRVKADHPWSLVEEHRRTPGLHIVTPVADHRAGLNGSQHGQQACTRLPGNGHTELAGTSAQDPVQIIGRLPGEIARKLSGQIAQRRSTWTAAGLAIRRLVCACAGPLGLQRLQALPQFGRRDRSVALEIVPGRIDQRGESPRLALGLGRLGCVSVVRHTTSSRAL